MRLIPLTDDLDDDGGADDEGTIDPAHFRSRRAGGVEHVVETAVIIGRPRSKPRLNNCNRKRRSRRPSGQK